MTQENTRLQEIPEHYRTALQLPSTASNISRLTKIACRTVSKELQELHSRGLIHSFPSQAYRTGPIFVILRNARKKHRSKSDQELFGSLSLHLEDPMSYAQMTAVTGLPRNFIAEAFKHQLSKGLLHKQTVRGFPAVFCKHKSKLTRRNSKFVEAALGRYFEVLQEPATQSTICHALDQSHFETVSDLQKLKEHGLIFESRNRVMGGLKYFCTSRERLPGKVRKPFTWGSEINRDGISVINVKAPTPSKIKKLGRYAAHLKTPKTPNEIASLVGCHQGNARRQLRKFMLEGLIHKKLSNPKTGQTHYCIDKQKLDLDA